MKVLPGWLATLLCLGCSALAGEAEGVCVPRACLARHMQAPPVVDGGLAEPCWEGMPVCTDFVDNVTGDPADPGCAFRLGFDGDALYLAVTALEPATEQIVAGRQRFDDEIWRDDCIEIFLQPDARRSAYYHLTVNSRGVRGDALEHDAKVDLAWSAGARVGTGEWTVEVAVPFAGLGGKAPPAGSVWRLNICRERQQGTSVAKTAQNSTWSRRARGFHEREAFGHLVFGTYDGALRAQMEETRVRLAAVRRLAPETPEPDAVPGAGLAVVAAGVDSEAGYRAAVGRLAARERELASILASAAARPTAGDTALMATPLDPYAGVPKDTTAQLVYLADAVGRAEAPLVLHTQQAVNEYEHAGFALSSRGPVSGLHFRSTDLLSKAGDRLPAAQVRVSAIGYLEPDPGYDPSYDCWNGVPQPDLVEEVRGEFALAACESRQFWLTVNSAGSAPGDYEGRLEIAASAPALSRVLPVRVEVWPVVLPQRPRLDVFLFAGIPWPGRSAELWADFLVEHYVSRVAIEQPGDIFVGEQRIEAAGREVKDIELEGGIAGREVTIRGERWGHLERLKTIRSRGLKLDLYSGRGIIKTVLWPAYVEYLARAGFSRADFRYKISDEDMDPWSLPIYQAFKGIDPDLDLVLCPAESWDITPYRPYVDTYMCSHSVTAWAQWLPYFREEQTRGKRLAVYTNWPSWAGRAPLEQVRRDLSWIWQIGADEYDAWAIDIDVPTGFTYPYGGRLRDVTGLATEKQTIAGLIYFRRDGDLFRPVSCKRLEAIRDGVKDWLYLDCLATLLARLPAEAQPAYRKVLDDALAAAGQSRADFCRRKLLLAKAIRALEQPGSPAGQGGK